MALLGKIKPLLHPHYIVNLMLALCFFILKVMPWVCAYLFEDCTLELREYELLTFLSCIVVVKARRQATMQDYFSTACLFSKLLNVFLFFRQNPIMAVVYVIACIVHLVMLPEPAYSGPEIITYFRGPNLEEELNRDKRITWIIEFYAAWSPACVSFARVFGELSAQYSLENLKFGKIDASRYTAVAEKFKVNASPWGKHLPTVIVFQNGKEKDRRPFTDSKGRPVTIIFSKENCIRELEINDLYHQCKQNPIPSKKEKNPQEKKDQ